MLARERRADKIATIHASPLSAADKELPAFIGSTTWTPPR